jgi:hypothetical protein
MMMVTVPFAAVVFRLIVLPNFGLNQANPWLKEQAIYCLRFQYGISHSI